MQTMPAMQDAPLCPSCKGQLTISMTRNKEEIADINARTQISEVPNPDIMVLLGCDGCRKAIVLAFELSKPQTAPAPKRGESIWGKPLIDYIS